jgi:hypothetical protein
MNERIIELANKANKDICYTFKMEEAKQLHELMEKFAELIVKECASICMKNQYEGTPLYNNGSISSAEFIKQHFGVE